MTKIALVVVVTLVGCVAPHQEPHTGCGDSVDGAAPMDAVDELDAAGEPVDGPGVDAALVDADASCAGADAGLPECGSACCADFACGNERCFCLPIEGTDPIVFCAPVADAGGP